VPSPRAPYPMENQAGDSLENTRVDNSGWAVLVLGCARLGTDGLDSPDNFVRLLVARNDFAKDDMLVVQPRGGDGGDEKLGAVGVGSSVGHGQQEWAIMLQLEVLVGELLAPDGLAASAVATGKVTTLKHEVGNDTVELAALVVLAIGAALADSGKILGGLGDDIVEEHKVDAALLFFLLSPSSGGLSIAVDLDDRASPGYVEKDLGARHWCG